METIRGAKAAKVPEAAHTGRQQVTFILIIAILIIRQAAIYKCLFFYFNSIYPNQTAHMYQ